MRVAFNTKNVNYDDSNFFPNDVLKINVNYRRFKDLLKSELSDSLGVSDDQIISFKEKQGSFDVYLDKVVVVVTGVKENKRYIRSVVHKINKNGCLTDILIYDAFTSTKNNSVAVSSQIDFAYEIKTFKVKSVNNEFVAFRNGINSSFGKGEPKYFSSRDLFEYVKNNL